MSISTRLLTAIVAVAVTTAGILAASAQRLADVPPPPGSETATFAGGCFWCVEADFDKVDGVLATISGYTGGTTKNPTYKQVTAGGTGHTEAVRIYYDPKKVSYDRLLAIFWRTHDLLDGSGQFCDRGTSYRPAIFAHSPEQLKRAEASKADIEKSGRFKQKIATEILPAGEFTRAEEYHQDFYKKDPGRYYSYRAGCGRDARMNSLWGAEAGGKVATN
jgi:peptide-methionine (S)-S-oxide reductase